MANLEVEDINKVADLARLSLKTGKTNEMTAEDIANDINNILKLVEQIQELKTEGIKPMEHPCKSTLRLRKDEVTEENKRDQMQASAPETEAGLYLVPKVVD